MLRAAARVGLSVAGSAAVSAGAARLHVLVAAAAVRRIDLDPNQSLFHAAMVVRMLTTPVSCHAGAPRPAPPRLPSRPCGALLHCMLPLTLFVPEIFLPASSSFLTRKAVTLPWGARRKRGGDLRRQNTG